MIYYNNDFWCIFKYFPNETFQGMFKGGVKDHLCRQMGVWLLWKWIVIEVKDKNGSVSLKRHREICWLWEDNYLQEYLIVCPD